MGITQLLVDGTNLLHAMSRGPDRQPPAALIGRLRGMIPAETRITIVFDGPPERGIRGERIAGGLTVQYGGRYSADTILVTLVEDVAMSSESSKATDSILVVTDDRDLKFALRKRGARTTGSAWLIGRLDRPMLSSPSVGNRRPPAPPRIAQQQPGEETEEDREKRWSPGRGATTKRGNPKRRPRNAPPEASRG
jgi:YacP-like NYN domain